MKLLIITQAVDTDDPVLGFFVRWIEEFAKRAEQIEVICLKLGKSDLPKNVRVHSLGKPASRFKYLWNFYKYIFSLKYDAVFVHMNQEYVLLGGWWWRLCGKKIVLWRNHKMGSIFTDFAVVLAHKVLYTSPESYTARFAKASKMPVGIDVNTFTLRLNIQKVPCSILFLGRISPVKRVDLFINALRELMEAGEVFTALIVGSPISREDVVYDKKMRSLVDALGLSETVTFKKGVKNADTVAFYNECTVYVNLTPSGSMDKTIFEAMAAGAVPVVSNNALCEVLPADLVVPEPDARSVARAIAYALKHTDSFREYVIKEHSLYALIDRIMNMFV